MIIIRVGTKKPKDFHVHKERLCRYSPFFRRALDRDWSEAKSNIITLPDDTPETFGIYCDWLYNISPFRVSDVPSDQDEEQKVSAFNIASKRYYNAYVFGDKVLDTGFTDMLIDHWMTHMKKWHLYQLDHLFKVFNLAVKGHPVRELLVDVMLYVGHNGWSDLTFWEEDNNREALSEITKALIRNKGKPINQNDAPFYKPNMCQYHWHTKIDTACYKIQREWGWLREQ